MPSKNMIRKGKRRQTVKAAYRLHRDAQREAEGRAIEQALVTEETAAAAATEGKRAKRKGAVASRTTLPNPDLPTNTVALEAQGADRSTAEPSRAQLHEEPHNDLRTKWELATKRTSEDVQVVSVGTNAAGKRLDAVLAVALPEISRARAQLLIENGQVEVDGKAAKASLKLAGGEQIAIKGEPQPTPLRAEPEDIPLQIVYEDADLAVVDKPAGMLVHAGAGDAAHNRGTLVNALLFHLGAGLSGQGGSLRPGIVHRLDKDTSGLILVAKNDWTHQRLATMFQEHDLRKVYLALVHGRMPTEEGTIDLPVGRDVSRRTRMTTRRTVENGARSAVSHWRVLERFGAHDEPAPFGSFTLVEVEIETGRTHQIRVHLAALGHPVVGDTLYGAPKLLQAGGSPGHGSETVPTLDRNFLHAAELDLQHPRTGEQLALRSPLPAELEDWLVRLRPAPAPQPGKRRTRPQIDRLEAK